MTSDTNQLIDSSVIRTENDKISPNKRVLDNKDDTTSSKNKLSSKELRLQLYSVYDCISSKDKKSLPNFDPMDLIGKSYISESNGLQQKATITNVDLEEESVALHYDSNNSNGVLTYNDFINSFHSKDEDGNLLWAFKSINGHRLKNGVWELELLWDSGEITWEPMYQIKDSDPISVAEYAAHNKLLDTPQWKWANRYNNTNKFVRLTQAYKTSTDYSLVKYKYGIRVPRNRKDALYLDSVEGDQSWQKAIETEINQILDYNTFEILEHGKIPPSDHKCIPLSLVFDVKHDLRRKARLVAGGHLTDPPMEDIYSGVVTTDSVRLAIFLAEHNNLEICVADIGNAYLEGYTNEKIYSIATSEFGIHKGKCLVYKKSLYGLKTSAARWHETLSTTLRTLHYKPSKADSDLWIRNHKTHYEYIAVYVDDLLFVGKNPKLDISEFQKFYTLKGIGTPDFYLGGDISRIPFNNPSGHATLMSARSFIQNVVSRIERVFERKLRSYTTPLPNGCHPEIDTSPLLVGVEISKYRMLVGSAMWAITLGRYDIMFATISMSRFGCAPRENHMVLMLQIFGYLKSHNKARILIDTNEHVVPHDVSIVGHNWRELYPGACEELPPDMPVPLMKPIDITVYVDADHASDLVTRRSVTGILILLNSTPIRWYSKRQNTIESSTYGSEFVAARIAKDMIVEWRYCRFHLKRLVFTGLD